MSNLNFLVNQPAEWLLSDGPESDIVVSSRLRLARNIAGFPFFERLTKQQKNEIVDKVDASIKQADFFKKGIYARYKDLTEIDRQFLLERHLISREHATESGDKAVGVTQNEVVSVMVLEEDHLRLQAFQAGLNLKEAWKIANRVDDEIEKNLDYSFKSDLGYLTACPTNVGTGLRASCMLHLPSLVLAKQIHKVLQALSKLNLAARGLYGEGTQAIGNFFQFSNQMTLGQCEDEIIENLDSVIRQVIGHEKEARQFLGKKGKFEDQIWRALGTLKSARIISSGEATQLLSLVQLGVSLGMISEGISRQDLNVLFLLIQPAHLQKLKGMTLNSSDRDIRRAELIREKLAKVPV